MPDLEQINHNKEKILSAIRLNGPSFPVRIAKEIGVSPLFASAFLSELKAESKLKVSNMKVGSSPLYFLHGQEMQLENFIEHLNSREREAYFLLKREKVLGDELQMPVMRVALRALKDFAFPIKIRVNGNSKLFWKYFSLSDNEVSVLVKQKLDNKIEQKSFGKESRAESIFEKEKSKSEMEKKNAGVKEMDIRKKIIGAGSKGESAIRENEVNGAKISDKEIEGNRGGISGEEAEKRISVKIIKEKVKTEHEFPKNVKEYLKKKDIEILEVLSEKKKEMSAKVRIDILFGKQEYFLLAKNKKHISDSDLISAMRNAQFEKLPALVISSGELGNKGKEYLEQWGNLIRFEKLK